MSTSTDYDYWYQRVLDSLAYQKEQFLPRADRNMNWYNGNYFDGQNNEKYWVNFAYSVARTIVSSIYQNSPDYSFLIKGNPEKHFNNEPIQLDKLAKCLELATKIYFRELESDRINRRAVLDSVWAGYGVTKMGYTYKLNNKHAADTTDSIEYNQLVKKAEPFKVRVNPVDMLFPPDAESFEELSYQIQIVYKDRESAESTYNVKNLPTVAVAGIKKNTLGTQLSGQDKVKLYEIHNMDPDNPEIITLCEGYPKILRRVEHPLYADGKVKNMFQYLYFNDRLNGLYPLSDFDLIQPQILEANIQIERRVNHVKRIVRMYEMRGIYDEQAEDGLKTGEDGTVLKTMNPDSQIVPIPNLDLGVDFYQNINNIRQEILEILGLTDYAIGGTTQKRKATEAAYMEQQRNKRVVDRINIVDRFVQLQVDTFIEIMKQYQKTDKLFKISIGDELIELQYSGALLATSDIDVQVVTGSTVSLDQDAELRKWQAVAQIAQGFPGLANMQAIWKKMLTQLGVKDPEMYTMNENPAQIMPGFDGQTPKIPGSEQVPGQPTILPYQRGQMEA